MKKSGETEHTLYEIPKDSISKYKLKKMQLFCLNLPLIFLIPIGLEFWPMIYDHLEMAMPDPEKAERAMGIFATSDMLIFLSGYKKY